MLLTLEKEGLPTLYSAVGGPQLSWLNLYCSTLHAVNSRERGAAYFIFSCRRPTAKLAKFVLFHTTDTPYIIPLHAVNSRERGATYFIFSCRRPTAKLAKLVGSRTQKRMCTLYLCMLLTLEKEGLPTLYSAVGGPQPSWLNWNSHKLQTVRTFAPCMRFTL